MVKYRASLLGKILTIKVRVPEVIVDDPEVIQAYQSVLWDKEDHAAIPIVNFLSQLVQSDKITMLDAEFVLDLLFSMYVHGAIFPWGHAQRLRRSHYALYAACNPLVELLSAGHGEARTLPEHPLHALWPKRQEHPITDSLITERASAWRAAGFIERRVEVLSRMMNDLTTADDEQFTGYDDELSSAYVDLLDFSRLVFSCLVLGLR